MATHLYSFTLVPPTAVVSSVIGQFSGQRYQEIVVAQGSRLQLLRADNSTDKLLPVLTTNLFGTIRSIASFRVAGASKDYIIVASDSGRISIVEYKPEQSRFVRVHLESFGKSGIRRVVPGQYLAVDPKGRATLIASIEKNKLVYILNRDSSANITISSPLEAHKPRSLLYDVVALDVGYDNPIFATLEVDYSDCDLDPTGKAYEQVKKYLTYYELDLGLNHVVRAWSDVVDRNANLLLAVPGGPDGPSGVLVCTQGYIAYKHMGKQTHQVPIPCRRTPFDDSSRKRTIVCGVMHKMKSAFFFLLQSDEGDLFKLTVEYDVLAVQEIKIKYFETVPLAKSLNILKSGFLFVAAEAGSHMLYRFEKLGDDDDEIEFSSLDYKKSDMNQYPTAYFTLQPLENLVLVDMLDSLNPLISSDIANLCGEDAPQIYALAGQGARSTFRTIRHGLEVTEIVESELPGEPIAVWTTKLKNDDEFDSYIVLSFVNGTLVLSIGETVEEASDSGFLSSMPTLLVQQVGEDSIVQVYPKGIRHISVDKEVNEWEAPLHTAIVAATANSRQVAIALSTSEIVYFELDEDGQLNEYQYKQEMGSSVTAMSVGEVPEGKMRNAFLAVGCEDSTVRLVSLDPDNTLESMSVQALTAPPSALSIMTMPDYVYAGSMQSSSEPTRTLYLHIGLRNGVYLRSVLDNISGELSDTQTQFLGPKPVKLFAVSLQEQPVVLALSSRPWLAYTYNVNFMITPLAYDSLEYGSGFSSEQCAEGVVGIEGKNLRIFSVEKFSENIKQDNISLTYTPRRLVRNPYKPVYYVIESDNNTLNSEEKRQLMEQQPDYEEPPVEEYGNARYNGKWASCVEVIDAANQEKTFRVELFENEAAFSVTVCSFADYHRRRREEEDEEGHDDEENEAERVGSSIEPVYVVVGTAKDLSLIPKKCSKGFLRVYRASKHGEKLEFVHCTELDEVPLAMVEFKEKLLVGAGGSLRLYDMGMKQLLRKAEYRNRNLNSIVDIQTMANRVVIADNQQSVTYLVYRKQDSRFLPLADDIIARHTTCFTMLDYSTIVGGDRFGNLWLVRASEKINQVGDDDDGALLLTSRPFLDGAPYRLDNIAHFFVQDIPTSVHRVQLLPGAREVIVYTGLQGTVGVLGPFTSREDIDFFQQLEGFMRTEDPPLSGRDHLIYRGQYVPVKNVIDGDLCEQYALLPIEKKRSIAAELDRTVREVERKIAGMRTRYAF
ncbi:CPSF A subunit region-domain-containing protein [Lipomyces oligophaga]|uniref:CPSF A subunit region-domain-containing protein n=1 Tax=Lipomyces oligophaga TaxID=45792 RepID=UPI0034CF60FA